jgi:hypothetical protein
MVLLRVIFLQVHTCWTWRPSPTWLSPTPWFKFCYFCFRVIFLQVRVVGVHLVEVEAKPYLALVQETAPGGDLGWQIEDCDFHTGRGGFASMVRRCLGLHTC